MAFIKPLKTNFTSGELDPKLHSREDLKHYYNGADRLRNVIAMPQGGVRRRWGTRFVDKLRANIRVIATGGITATAPQGGTANNALDDTGFPGTLVTTTVNIGVIDPYVVIHYDLGAPVAICIAEIRNAHLTNLSTAVSSDFCIQYSTDNVVWTTLGDPVDNLNFDEYVTFRRSAPPGTSITARYWRFARIGATDMTTARIEISDFVLREELNGSGVFQVSGGYKLIPIDYDRTTKYMMVATDDNVAVYLDETWQTDIRHTPDGSDLEFLNWCQSFDTVITFFEDEQPKRMIRRGADNEWKQSDLAFDVAPVYRFSDTPQPGTITIDPSAISGNGISLIASAAFWKSNMVDWIVTLPPYKGSGAGAAIITAFVSNVNVTADVLEDFAAVAVPVPNAEVREPAFTSARGWPGGGVFHDGRLYLFNHPLAKNVVWASRSGLPFNFDDTQDLDDYGFSYELTSDNPPQIFAMLSARHLSAFAHASEFYALPSDQKLTPKTVVFKKTTDSGSKQIGLRPVQIDGAVLFVRAGGMEIDEFIYNDGEQAYQADAVTLFSAHLVNDIQQIFTRPALNTAETNHCYAVNGDGTLACLATLRRQDVTAWSLLQTNGRFLQGESVASKIFLVVEREINGQTVHYLEVADFDSKTDCGLRGSITVETYTATAGQTVFTWTFTDPASASLVGVKQNGVRLDYLVDYTVDLATNTVTLLTGAAAGDTVTLHQLIASVTLAHLPNTQVKLYNDSSDHGLVTTSAAGVVTFTSANIPYHTWEAGLAFPDVTGRGEGDELWVRDVPVTAQLPDGSIVGDLKSAVTVIAQVEDTSDIFIGANGQPLYLASSRNFDEDTFDSAPPRITGNLRVEGLVGYDEFGRVEITQRGAGDFTLLSIKKEVSI